MLGLELSQILAWDSNQCGWDSSPVKIQGLPIEIKDLVSEPNKLRFLTSHHGKNSVIDKVIGKKWIYSERNTPQTECRPSQKEEQLNLEYFSFSIKKSVSMQF